MIPKIKSVKCSYSKYRQLFLTMLFLNLCSISIMWISKSNVIILRQLQPQNEMSDKLSKYELLNFEHLQISPDKNIQTMTKSRELWENQEGQSNWYKLQVSSSKKSHEQIKEEDHLEGKSISLVKTPEQAQQQALSKTLMNIDMCMSESNLTSPALLQIAKENAQLFMEQYGKVISPQYLDGYVNYCWNTEYHLTLDKPFTKGHIDGNDFNRRLIIHWFAQPSVQYFKERSLRTYNSSTVCLPNLYVLGFEKCGSTFFWCLLSEALNKDLTGMQKNKIQSKKEPYFWTPLNYKPSMPNYQSLAGEYIPMFLTASNPKIQEATRKNITLIDGCPSTVIEWPHFTDTEPELANYCLLPSALPELFPQSKYLVIMREPVSMMYSAFWWSFITTPKKFDSLSQSIVNNHSRGPMMFHLHAKKKIIKFLSCMNNHPTVRYQKKCTLWGKGGDNYTDCISNRTHLLSECVANITNKREFLEAVLHRGIYYVHVRKWLQTVPRDRIFFTTMKRLTKDTHSVAKKLSNFFGKVSDITQDEVERMKHKCRTNSNRVNYKTSSLMMKESTKAMLETFFKPFNRMLSELLEDEQFMWQKVS